MTKPQSILIAIVLVGLCCSSVTACLGAPVKRLKCRYDAQAAAATSDKSAIGHRGSVRSLFFARNGAALYSSGWDGQIRVWSLKSGATKEVLSARSGPVSLAFTENQQTVALAVDGEAELVLFDLLRKRETALEAHQSKLGLRPYTRHTFSADGALIAVPRQDGPLGLWNIKVGQTEGELTGHDGPVEDLCFAPDDQMLATGGQDGTVRLWDLESGEEISRWKPFDGSPVVSVDYSFDGRLLAIADNSGAAAVLDARTGEAIVPLESCNVAEGVAVHALRFSPSGRALFGVKRAGCVEQYVCIWDAASGDSTAAIEIPITEAIDFSADGTMMATGGCGCDIIIWDLEMGAPIGQLGGSCRLEVQGACD